jgi:hypothetical protein
MRIPATAGPPDPQVHPGRDWFYVIEGTARLLLGDRELLIEEGSAAEFSTMTPHWIGGHGGPDWKSTKPWRASWGWRNRFSGRGMFRGKKCLITTLRLT